jgi:hypothetical protein
MTALLDHVPIPTPLLQLVSTTHVQFQTHPGFVHQPERSTNLPADAWSPLGPPIVGDGATAAFPIPTGDSPVYLRVATDRAP